MKIILEIETEKGWMPAGSVTLLGDQSLGTTGPCLLEYDSDYAFKYLSEMGHHAFSCRYPVNFSVENPSHWPAFLLDLMPSGAARRILENKLKIKNAKEFDGQLLKIGACNPIGNIRVQVSDAITMIDDQHPGFELAQILEKEEGFLDYALECGAPVSGTTGVAGDAPKFTLSKSIHDRWYPGGSLSKKYIDSEWIIKFLRGRTKADHVILESEAQLYRLAEDLGLRGGFQPIYQDYALLIPRFDVVREGGELRRLGVESLSSTMGVFEFGQSASHENALKTIFKVTTSSLVEVAEYMMRDFFNTLIGNTDNHGRNTSLLKHLDGRIELSPLYDCAPMALDPQMITRTITWDEVERDRVCHGLPKLSSLWIWMEKCDMETELVKQELNKFLRKLDVLDLNDYNWPGDLLSFLEKNKKRMIESFL